jgi:hypothetical protein
MPLRTNVVFFECDNNRKDIAILEKIAPNHVYCFSDEPIGGAHVIPPYNAGHGIAIYLWEVARTTYIVSLIDLLYKRNEIDAKYIKLYEELE